MYDIYTYLCTACVNLLICFLNETFVFITKSCWHVLIVTLFCLVTIPWHSCSVSRHTVSMSVTASPNMAGNCDRDDRR